ncbi:MAG TPA: SRPBCC domain-containing protein, partial [Anaeromyxobacter sp.]
PENYHTVTIELSSGSGGTQVVLTQDNNATEEAKQHSQENWEMMLAGLKKLLESAQPGDVRAGR